MSNIPKISKGAARVIERSFAEILPSIDTPPEKVEQIIFQARKVVREVITSLEKQSESEGKHYIPNRALSERLRLEAEKCSPSTAQLVNGIAQSVACLLKGDGSYLGEDPTAFTPLHVKDN